MYRIIVQISQFLRITSVGELWHDNSLRVISDLLAKIEKTDKLNYK